MNDAFFAKVITDTLVDCIEDKLDPICDKLDSIIELITPEEPEEE